MNLSPLNSISANVFSLVVMIGVAHFCSLFIWQIIDHTKDTTVSAFINPTILKDDDNANRGDIFANYPLFGAPQKVKKNVTKKKQQKPPKKRKVTKVAPKVTFKLRGILKGARSFAIIDIAREQGVYAEGENLSYLYIEEIGNDYVIFSDAGVEHKVFVSDDSVSIGGGEASDYSADSDNKKAVQPSNNNANVRDNNALPTYTPNLSFKEKQTFQNYKKSLTKNPLQMIGKVNAHPYRENGKLVGYQVTPGSEKALFGKVGLKAGDIILSANGQSLENVGTFTEGMKFMEQLGKASTLDLLINRRGTEQRIYITLE